MKKMLVFLLMFAMTLSMLVGCSKETESSETVQSNETTESDDKEPGTEVAEDTEDELEFVELKMYLLGDKPADFDMVYEEVNKKLKEDINASLTVDFLGWSDYSDKYPLLFASGEAFDLIYTSDFCFYDQTAVSGGFLELTDELLEQYAPQTYANTTSERFDQVKINGKVYMLPYTKPEYSNNVYVVRGDLMDEFGMDSIAGFDDYITYLDNVASKHPELVPYDDGNVYSLGNLMNLYVGTKNEWAPTIMLMPISYNIADSTDLELFNYVDTPEYLDYILKAKEYGTKGYWSADAIVNGNTSKDSFVNGKSASCIINLGDANSCAILTQDTHPEWDVRVYDSFEGMKTLSRTGKSNGVAINANAENPERALMLLDLFKYDKEYYDLTNYGIEGVHYEPLEGNRFKTLEAYQNFPPSAACPWGWMTDGYERTAENAISNYEEIFEGWNETLVTHPLQSFGFDDSSLKNEIAACSTVMDEYMNTLQLGYYDDVEATYQEFLQALDSAGLEKIIAEFQRQIDENLK